MTEQVNTQTMKEFDDAANHLLPNIKKAKENGISFNRPDLVKMVSEKYFLESMNSDWNPDKETKDAYRVIHFAAVQLNNSGSFNFKD